MDRGSGFLYKLSPNPVPAQRHLQQTADYHTVMVGQPFLLPPRGLGIAGFVIPSCIRRYG